MSGYKPVFQQLPPRFPAGIAGEVEWTEMDASNSGWSCLARVIVLTVIS